MALLRPPALQPGSTFGIVSPASASQPQKVQRGIVALERLGYKAKLMPHALDQGPLNFAGTCDDRADDLHAAFLDPEVDAVLCTRGGWGSAELLPQLDAALLRDNPKPFLGYSDITSLHLWMMRQAGLVVFHAPMLAADFARDDSPHPASWSSALTQTAPWSLGVDSGLRVLQAGHAEGMLTGGCIAIVAEALGTPYAAPAQGGILFLEDVNVKPYQWNRMLLHLRYAGAMEGVTGIVFGDMAQCSPAEEYPLLEHTLLHALRWFHGPIAIGLRSGHVAGGNITLPLGVEVRLDCRTENPTLHFASPAVRL